MRESCSHEWLIKDPRDGWYRCQACFAAVAPIEVR